MTNSHEISLAELREALSSEHPPRVLDVREPHELEISRLPELTHIPLGDLPNRFEELDRDADWVVMCRTGGRSGKATQFLLGQGFSRVRNAVGGMNGWASEIDPSLPTY